MDSSQARPLQEFSNSDSPSRMSRLGSFIAGLGSNSGVDFSGGSLSASFRPPGGVMMDGSVDTNLMSASNFMNLPTSSSLLSPSKGSEEGHSSSDSHQLNTRSSKAPKFCGVCGDRAKSYHFGGLACDSCKAFFRRSVHNDAYKSFRCAYNECCHITKNTRKGCQKCRFEKCTSIGMEKNWVMSEQERSIFNQQRMKKRKGGDEEPTTTSQPTSGADADYLEDEEDSPRVPQRKAIAYEPEVGNMIQFITDKDQAAIKKVVEDYRLAYSKIPYRVPHNTDGPRNSVQIIEMFTTILRRFAYFCTLVPEFQSLSKDDQGKLLRESVLEMCLLRGALSFDATNHRWPNTSMEFLKDCPQLKFDDVENLVDPELHMMHINFIKKMQKLQVDEPTMMLLLMVVLFYPDTVVSDQKAVMNAESKYLSLLETYVNWRYGPKRGPRLYPHLLTKLIDLRHLNDVHTEFHLKLARDDIKVIQQDLANLKIERTGTPENLEALSGSTTVNRDACYPEDDIQLVDSSITKGANTTTSLDGAPINTSDILEHTTGRQNSKSPPTRSPLHIKQRLLNADPQRLLHKRQCSKNPMAEVFLQRIPALIEDPFAPMVTESEIFRFKEVMARGGAGPLQIPSGFDPSTLFNRFPQSHISATATSSSSNSSLMHSGSLNCLSPTHGNSEFGATTSSPVIPPGFLPGQYGHLSVNLPPHELELAKRIQESLSPEKRAQLRAMFFPDGATNNSTPATGVFNFGGSHISPNQLSSFLPRTSSTTSSPTTGYNGVSEVDMSHIKSPMRKSDESSSSLRTVETPVAISSGPSALAASSSTYQVHPQVRLRDPSSKKPQFNYNYT